MFGDLPVPPINSEEYLTLYNESLQPCTLNNTIMGATSILLRNLLNKTFNIWNMRLVYMPGDLYNICINDFGQGSTLLGRTSANTIDYILINLARTQMCNREIMQELIQTMKELGYIQNSFVSAGFAKSNMHRQVFYNMETFQMIIFYDDTFAISEMEKMFAFASTILNLPHAQLTDQLIQLCTWIATDNKANISQAYLQWYDENKSAFQAQRYTKIKDAFLGIQTNRLNNIRNAIDLRRAELEGKMQEYQRIQKQLRDYEQQFILESASQESNAAVVEFIEYIQEFKSEFIVDIVAEPGILRLKLKAPCVFHRAEDLEQLIRSSRTAMYSNREAMLRALFLNDRFRLWLYGCFKIDLNIDSVTAIRVEGISTKGILHNKHLTSHSCMGGYFNKVQQCLQQADYIMALETLISCTGSLTWADSTVMNSQFNILDASLETPGMVEDTHTNEYITIREAMRRYAVEKTTT